MTTLSAHPFSTGEHTISSRFPSSILGWVCRFADGDGVDSFAEKIDENTKQFISKRWVILRFNIPDFEGLARLAETNGIPLVVDNTLGACGALFRPIDYGANVVVESATKWIGGHGTSIGGVIVDAGNFNWGNGRFPLFTEPSESYHGMKFWEVFGTGGPVCQMLGLLLS